MGILGKLWVSRKLWTETIVLGDGQLSLFVDKLHSMGLAIEHVVDCSKEYGAIQLQYFATDEEKDEIRYYMNKLKEFKYGEEAT